jgi:hypothetical protein
MPVFYKKDDHILIQTDSCEDWRSFFNCCDGYLMEDNFSKIFEYLKNDVKTIVLEKKYYDADYRNTYFNFFSHKFANYPNKTLRANFFSKKISPRMLFKLDRYQEDYIGFIVIRPNRVASIGRTILNPKKIRNINGYICMAEYPVHILGAELIARGFPYISQDTDVTICAHAACWMLFRYFSQRYTRYAEVWPYEVTQLTEDLSSGRLVPSKGLTVWQITEMFSKFGFYPENYFREIHPNFDKLLYQYVESGLPVVAGLTKHEHAITIIGHVSDFSTRKPPCTSDQYLTAFVANDDNYMPYQTIRKDDPKPAGHVSDFKIKDIDSFVVPLYEKIHLSAEHVMELSEAILTHKEFGIDARSSALSFNQIITRTFLTSSKSYKKERRKDTLPFGILKVYLELSMPKFIWICEISTPNLYQDGKIVGEIIFDATASQFDRLAFLMIHYPDFLLLNNRSCLTDDPKRFTVHAIETENIVSYPCYVNNLCEV